VAIWDELTGQAEAIAVFQAAAGGRPAPVVVDIVEPSETRARTGTVISAGAGTENQTAPADEAPADAAPASASGAMTHSWLITGPPGSGRSNLAFAFATALLSAGTPHDDEVTRRQVEARTHPDLNVLGTTGVIIKRDDVREMVRLSHYSPSVSRYRVIVVEDADRMTEQTSNVLLKELEEPPERTVWILCAPSEADLLPTIRSRVRTVRLRVPSVDDVAELLISRDGVDAERAERAARHAQSHIGMARRLATNGDARDRRDETLRLALGVRGVSDAVMAAARMLEIAGADAKALTEETDAEERANALRSLGVAPGGTLPPALRSQMRALEEEQKRRATRSLRDGIDRILVDLLSLYRDVMMVQLGTGSALVNRELHNEVASLSKDTAPADTLAVMDAIATARSRIDGNVAPALALEAMLVSVVRKGT
jgi:DNA polymerase-3 subunit delta'